MKNNRKNKPLNYLVLVLGSNDEISKGSIVQYTNGSEVSSPLASNTFSNLFTQKFASLNGTFSVLNIFDSYVYALKFENGKLKSLKEPSKKENGNNLRDGDGCVDWYWVTTYYYPDGTSYTYEEFFTRTCPDGEGCYNNELESVCPGQGGGTPPPSPMDYEVDGFAEPIWNVYTSTDGYNKVSSHEKLTGKRRPNGGSTISGISHWLDGMSNQFGYDHPTYATWHRDAWTPSVAPDNKSATARMQGEVHYPDNRIVSVDQSSTWFATILR